MSTNKQQFCLTEFKWRGSFPISKQNYSVVISLQNELTGLFGKYILELMPEYEVILIDTKQKFEELKIENRKIYLFDCRNWGSEKYPLWEDIDKLDEIKYKIFMYDENTKRIPRALLTKADLIILEELRDYMTMFFSGISFSIDKEVVAYIIDKTEMSPFYYFFDSRLMLRTFKVKVEREKLP